MLGPVLLAAAVALVLYMLVLWAVSLRLDDVSIVDPGWAFGFIIVAWVAYAVGDGAPGRRLLLAVLVTLWGVRLGGHLLARKLSSPGEDRRYTAMRDRYGPRFPWTSLGIVFLPQGALIWIVALAVQVPATRDGGLGWLDWTGAAVWAVGLAFEATGDEQLRRFKADPANRGKVMDRGLWRYTRHPNYFGDFVVWWGIYIVAVSAGAWWTVVGPLVMSFLLLRVSGVRLLESDITERRPGYADYVARTSAFVPLPPRRSRGSSR